MHTSLLVSFGSCAPIWPLVSPIGDSRLVVISCAAPIRSLHGCTALQTNWRRPWHTEEIALWHSSLFYKIKTKITILMDFCAKLGGIHKLNRKSMMDFFFCFFLQACLSTFMKYCDAQWHAKYLISSFIWIFARLTFTIYVLLLLLYTL